MLAGMKNAVIAGLIGALAIGGALGAFAATRVVETEAGVDVRVWQRVSDGELFVSTRPEGGGEDEWVTSAALDMSSRSNSGRYYLSPLVTVAVPVLVEVEVAEPVATPPGERATFFTTDRSLASCCEVEGLDDDSETREEAVEIMEGVIEFAWKTYGFTHRGGITINLAHSESGMLVRYEQAFGERLEALPDGCSFQRGEHVFFTPECRLDEAAYTREYFARVLEPEGIEPAWIAYGTLGYVPAHQAGRAPALNDDAYLRAAFYEDPGDLRRDEASEAMQTMGMLYALEHYGDIKDWIELYDRLLLGEDASSAFEAVLGVTLPEFYGAFEAWGERQELILIAGSFPSCYEASQSLRPQQGSVGTGRGFPDFRVPLAVDEDGDGIVCEGAYTLPLCEVPGLQ